MAKFKKDDKVILTKQAPKYVIEELQPGRKRTVTSTYYDKGAKRHVYHVGTNRMGEAESLLSAYPFRSYHLRLAPSIGKAGRPKSKRRYRRRR